jgi:hypothetical protein
VLLKTGGRRGHNEITRPSSARLPCPLHSNLNRSNRPSPDIEPCNQSFLGVLLGVQKKIEFNFIDINQFIALSIYSLPGHQFSNSYLPLSSYKSEKSAYSTGGGYTVFMDSSKKHHARRKECLCRTEESTPPQFKQGAVEQVRQRGVSCSQVAPGAWHRDQHFGVLAARGRYAGPASPDMRRWPAPSGNWPV